MADRFPVMCSFPRMEMNMCFRLGQYENNRAGVVGAAEQELKEKTEKYAAKSKIDPSTYGCTMMSNDAYREDGVHNFYSIGQKVNLITRLISRTEDSQGLSDLNSS